MQQPQTPALPAASERPRPRRPSKALRVEGRFLVDREQRVVLLRGVNAGGDAKLAPFFGISDERCADQIASWGCNAVRLPTVWEAIEPAPGRYDQRYLDRLAEVAGWLTSRGLYVFVDMHQDLFSRCFRGDGAPDWAVRVEPRLRDPALLAKPRGGPEWFWNYPTEPVTAAFTAFWTDGELQDHFLGALTRVAQRLAGDERVFGYEVFNEPWQGRFDLPSGEFERKVLAPFYERAAACVREVDPDAVVVVEPAPFIASIFNTQSRLPILEGGNMVYAPHHYAAGALLGNEPHVPTAVRNVFRQLAMVAEKAAELGMPALLGEFGTHPRQPDAIELLHGYYDALDRHLMGGLIWTYAPRDHLWNDEGMSLVDEGLGERQVVEAVVRPYPRAIAGVPQRLEYNWATRVMQLVVDGPAGEAPTEVVVPRRIYPRGAVAKVSSGRAVESGGLLTWSGAGTGRRTLEVAPAP